MYFHNYQDSGCGDGHYQIKVPKCEKHVLKMQKGYQKGLNCGWELVAESGRKVDITVGWNRKQHGCITRLPRQNEYGICDTDYLEIDFGDGELVKLCGSVKNLKKSFGKFRSVEFNSTDFSPKIRFHSNDRQDGKRFEKGFCLIISDNGEDCNKN